MPQRRALVYCSLGLVLAASPVRSQEQSPQKTYKVWIWQENGDTLWRIAQKVYGDKDKWPLIYEANRDTIQDPNKIYPKQVLKIPPIDWQPSDESPTQLNGN